MGISFCCVSWIQHCNLSLTEPRLTAEACPTLLAMPTLQSRMFQGAGPSNWAAQPNVEGAAPP